MRTRPGFHPLGTLGRRYKIQNLRSRQREIGAHHNEDRKGRVGRFACLLYNIMKQGAWRVVNGSLGQAGIMNTDVVQGNIQGL